MADGLDHVVDVAPKGAEPLPARHVAVAHDDVGEVELREVVERAGPVFGIAVTHVGCPADHRVTGDHDLLFREIDEHVALGVSAAEMQQVDLAVAPVELHRLLEGDRGQGRLERADLAQVGLGEPQVGLELAALGRARRLDVGLELGDLARHLAHVVLDALESLLEHGLTRDLIGDDLRVGIRRRVGLVAVPVVPVEVRVDHVADRLLRHLAQALDDHLGGRRLRVRVDDHDAVGVLDDGRVAIHLVRRGRDSGVDAVGDFLDVEPRVSAIGSFVRTTIHRGLSLPVQTFEA